MSEIPASLLPSELTRLPQTVLALALAGLACGSAASPEQLQDRTIEALHQLSERQQAFRLGHGRYAARGSELGNGAGVPDTGVRIIIHDGDSSGWAASASHPGAPGAACVIYHGTPPAQPFLPGHLTPSLADRPVCTDFAIWKREHRIVCAGAGCPAKPYPQDPSEHQ